jgi:hypothetical protein
MRKIQPISVNFEIEVNDIDPVELLGVFSVWLELYGTSAEVKPQWVTKELDKVWEYMIAHEMYCFILRMLYLRGHITYTNSYYLMFKHLADKSVDLSESIIPVSSEDEERIYHVEVLLKHILPSLTDKAYVVREIILGVKDFDIGDNDPIEYLLKLVLSISKQLNSSE